MEYFIHFCYRHWTVTFQLKYILIITCILITFFYHSRLVRRDAIEIIVRRSKMGDWFLLYRLGENLDSIIFRDVMQDLANRLHNNQHHRVPGMKGEIQDA